MRHSEAVITRDGTIACKGATLMSGYLGDRQLTAEVMHDGTVFTSDMGEIDSQGCLHIKGRNSDVINIGGYKVAPQEVEDAAASFPQLAECLCCPTLSPVFGHTVKLIYTAKNDASIDKRALARHIAARVEGYKVPRVFEQVAAIRHTFNGKPDRKYYNGL